MYDEVVYAKKDNSDPEKQGLPIPVIHAVPIGNIGLKEQQNVTQNSYCFSHFIPTLSILNLALAFLVVFLD